MQHSIGAWRMINFALTAVRITNLRELQASPKLVGTIADTSFLDLLHNFYSDRG